MRIDFNTGQGLSSKPQSIQENIYLFVDEIFFEGLQLSFFLPPQQTPPYRHRKVIPHRNTWFSSCLSAEYYLGVPEVDPNKKLRKNFFVKNDHAQYGKEFCNQALLKILDSIILQEEFESRPRFLEVIPADDSNQKESEAAIMPETDLLKLESEIDFSRCKEETIRLLSLQVVKIFDNFIQIILIVKFNEDLD